ncbi:OmpW/AlkL family protein [Sphingomonas nostoxanthinifaciens]|uniref:OmpW/AlkL family protein n=1 Tax=Sphingomonas nostoxanthinifaciens TaxID=2872652 RepID=UPI001CC2107B|nr:OmpW family outer membrane protein [Sphingomonas nostoxanthinifaciens]UAK25965.1 outer membrane beta-barrel protein [Sphingomonas nostoxanthinifaciens]
MQVRTILASAAAAFLVATPALAEQGDWLIRARAIMVAPLEKSGPVEPSFPGAHVAVNNGFSPELDFTYMWTNHIGTELILGTTKHDVSGRGSLDGLGKLAHARVLPPTLTLQYHLLPAAHVRPYVGAGVNYSIFYSEKATQALDQAIGATKVGLSDSVGYALQAGLDVDITRKVFANIDFKYLDINTNARLTTGSTVNRVHVNLDPIVVGFGFGIRL